MQQYHNDAPTVKTSSTKSKWEASHVELPAQLEGADLFHDRSGRAFITIVRGEHQETYAIQSGNFLQYIDFATYKRSGVRLKRSEKEELVSNLVAKAKHEGPAAEVFVRVAKAQGKIYLDLANDEWQVVEVDKTGWRILAHSPVKFWRPPGTLALPQPRHDADGHQKLRRLLGITDADDACCVEAWLIAALSPDGPFLVLLIVSPHGSGKSFLTRILRALIDPNVAASRGLPREERDLVIAASNSWMIALDNVSEIPPTMSDALCRLSTGAGFGTRRLYSDDEEILFQTQRPVIINGVFDISDHEDLLDRAIVIGLPAIPEENRRPEAEVWEQFERDRPAILGYLLDVVACALDAGDLLRPDKLPRMADFAAWIAAAEPSAGWEVSFEEAYAANREKARQLSLEASPIGEDMVEFAERVGEWSGTAAELLLRLKGTSPRKRRRGRKFPDSPRALSHELRRIVLTLRTAGIEVEFSRESGGNRARTILLRTVEE